MGGFRRDEGVGKRLGRLCKNGNRSSVYTLIKHVNPRMNKSSCLLKSPRATAPVTVVNIEAFALQDKCANAVLDSMVSLGGAGDFDSGELRTRLLATVLMPCTGIVAFTLSSTLLAAGCI